MFSARDLRNELKGLVGKAYFDDYDPDKSMEELLLGALDKVIEEYVP